MQCPNCQAELADGAQTCGACGAVIVDEQTAAPPNAAPPAPDEPEPKPGPSPEAYEELRKRLRRLEGRDRRRREAEAAAARKAPPPDDLAAVADDILAFVTGDDDDGPDN